MTSMLLALLHETAVNPALVALLKHLTVAEAGLALAAVCRAARDAVRAFDQWRPMWNREHAVARLRSHYLIDWYGPSLFRELESLARLLVDELQPAGVISLSFSLADARAKRMRSLLGCHELRVLQPVVWIERLHYWALNDGSGFSDGLDDNPRERENRMRYPSVCIINLLRKMRLQRTRKFDKRLVVAPANVVTDKLCWYVWENNLLDY